MKKKVVIAYQPEGGGTRPKVLFGKHIYPGEQREITEKQYEGIKGDADFALVRRISPGEGGRVGGLRFGRRNPNEAPAGPGEGQPEPPAG